MTKRYVIPLFMTLFLLTGCATPGGHTLLGGFVGAAAGVAMGFVADSGPQGRGRAQNVFAGMALGSILGAGTGYLLEQGKRPSQDAKEEKKPTVPEAADRREPGQPILIPPRVDGKFVDDQIRGNTFIPGHFEYQIKEPAKWRRYEANPDH